MHPPVPETFQAALDHVDVAWVVLQDLFVWADRQPDSARRQTEYEQSLDFVQGELGGEFADLARMLARVVLDWPAWEQIGPESLDGHLSSFHRYWTMLRLTVKAGDVPAAFRILVNRVAQVLEPHGHPAWFVGMNRHIEAIIALEPAPPYRDGTWPGRALDILLHALPEEDADDATLSLLGAVEGVYTSAGHAPPPWVRLLHDQLSGPED
jgi:hypothetical protein